MLRIQDMEYKVQAIFDSSNTASVFIGKDLLILFANKKAKSVCEIVFGAEANIGKKILDYIESEYQPEFINHFNEVFIGKTVMVEKFWKNRWWLFNIFPVYDHENQLIGISFNT